MPHRETKMEEIVVTKVSKGPVEGNKTVNYTQQLDIPPLPPSNLVNCGIIDLEYYLKVKACVEGWLVINCYKLITTVVGANYIFLINYFFIIHP